MESRRLCNLPRSCYSLIDRWCGDNPTAFFGGFCHACLYRTHFSRCRPVQWAPRMPQKQVCLRMLELSRPKSMLSIHGINPFNQWIPYFFWETARHCRAANCRRTLVPRLRQWKRLCSGVPRSSDPTAEAKQSLTTWKRLNMYVSLCEGCKEGHGEVSLYDMWQQHCFCPWRRLTAPNHQRARRRAEATTRARAHGTSSIVSWIPVVPHKAVAEVSKMGNYRRGELLWWMDGRANPLMARKVVGVVLFGVVAVDNCWI